MDEGILRLIDKFEASRLTTLDYQNGDVALHLSQVATTGDAPVVEAPPATLPTIDAPLVGIVYLAAKPGEPVYKQVGDPVAVGDVLCVIESMKMMNPVKATVAGVVEAVLVADGALVEYQQPLFVITPKEESHA